MTNENMTPFSDDSMQHDAVREYHALQTMKKTFGRIGWSVFVLIAAWYGFIIALGIAIGVLDVFGIHMMDFYERYMLIFNELGLALGIVAAMRVLRKLPCCEFQGEKISALRFMKYMAIGLAIGSVGNIIGNTFLTFWNTVTGNEAGAEVDELLLGSNYLILILMVGLIGPFLEEFFFRKLLIDRMRGYGELACILVSGVLFGLFHGNFTQFFYAFGLGSLLAYLYLRSGSFALTFIFHALFNIVSGILPAFLTEMGSGAETVYVCVYVVLVIVGAFFALAGIRRLKLRKGESVLPRKKAVSSIILNPGMIAAVCVMLGMMAVSLFTV